MTNGEIRKTLEKQLQLLFERSQDPRVMDDTLISYSQAISEIAKVIITC